MGPHQGSAEGKDGLELGRRAPGGSQGILAVVEQFTGDFLGMLHQPQS